jgi:hypothetical protein
MAARTTATEVKKIIDTSLSDSIVEAYIGDANVMVNEVLGTDTTDLLTSIEKWLTAHLIAMTQERVSIKEEAGTAKITYPDVFGQGLKATPYGQMVLTLDTSGSFAALGGKSATIEAIKSFD